MSELNSEQQTAEQQTAEQQTAEPQAEENKVSKDKKRHYYPTNPSLYSYIVNAKTGIKYPVKFNSAESSALYHVIDSTAKYDKNGFIRNRKNNYINEPNHLFYDSPEQYKMHNGSKISTNEIITWHNKQKELNINIYNAELQKNEHLETVTVEVK